MATGCQRHHHEKGYEKISTAAKIKEIEESKVMPLLTALTPLKTIQLIGTKLQGASDDDQQVEGWGQTIAVLANQCKKLLEEKELVDLLAEIDEIDKGGFPLGAQRTSAILLIGDELTYDDGCSSLTSVGRTIECLAEQCIDALNNIELNAG